MKLIKLNCSNCNAQLEIDLDHIQVYCPYCGQKLMIDLDNFEEILREREKTKRTTVREEEQTKRAKMEYEYRERTQNQNFSFFQKQRRRMTALFLLLILIAGVYFGNKFREHALKNEVRINFSAEDVEGEYYQDVAKRFESLGFNNIELIKKEDLILAIFSKDGEVDKVTINGDSSFLSGEWYSTDSDVTITYHSFKEKTK